MYSNPEVGNHIHTREDKKLRVSQDREQGDERCKCGRKGKKVLAAEESCGPY